MSRDKIEQFIKDGFVPCVWMHKNDFLRILDLPEHEKFKQYLNSLSYDEFYAFIESNFDSFSDSDFPYELYRYIENNFNEENEK